MIEAILEKIESEIDADAFWGNYLREHVIQQPPAVTVHLAVFVEPYLQYIIEGKKTVESRFSVNRTPPYGNVKDGDVIFLKKAGGPVTGICKVTNVWNYQLDPESLNELRSEFAAALCAQDPEFWAVRSEASYATLMRIDNVRSLIPFSVDKRDQRGWVILKRRTNQLMLWDD